MKKLKKLAVAAALVTGVALGFGMAAWPGNPQCTRDRDCDAICGGPGTGVCSAWKCYCIM
jgi:hypothetical protein